MSIYLIMDRDASNTFNGFIYQRHVCIYLFLTNNDVEFILEEGQEDIDLIIGTQIINSVQVKYYKYGANETFQKNEGLYKVVEANYDKTNFEKITYLLYNQKDFYSEHLKIAFDKKQYGELGKYFIIQYFNEKNIKNAIKVKINNIDSITKIYNDNKSKINNFTNNDFNKIKVFFEMESNCNAFFSKITLEKGYSFDELNNKINNQIKINYKNFIEKTNNESQNKIKIPLIFNCIYNILNDFIFEHKNSKNRKIHVAFIKDKINNLIKLFENETNLLSELLKQKEISLKNTFKSTENNITNVLLVNNLHELNSLNYNIEILIFHIDLLNKKYEKINDNTIELIKNFIVNICFKLKNKDTFEYNKKFIGKINHIVYYKGKKSKFKLPRNKLIQLFDNNLIIKKYF